MSKCSSPGAAGHGIGIAALALVPVLVTACGLKQEQRIEDPSCENCYELRSGVKYKTFEYYDP